MKFGFPVKRSRVTDPRAASRNIQVGEPIVDVGAINIKRTSEIPCPLCFTPLTEYAVDSTATQVGRAVAILGPLDDDAVDVLYDPVPIGTIGLGCKPCWVMFWTTKEGLELAANSSQ